MTSHAEVLRGLEARFVIAAEDWSHSYRTEESRVLCELIRDALSAFHALLAEDDPVPGGMYPDDYEGDQRAET